MNEITMKLMADKLIMQALEEDITSEDITTNAVMRERREGEVELICKEDGIIAGLWVFERVFTLLDPSTTVTLFVKDGDEVKKGQKMGVVTGDIRVLLSGERTALNYLQRMSGIATYTRVWQNFWKERRPNCLTQERQRRTCGFLKNTPSAQEAAIITGTIFPTAYC